MVKDINCIKIFKLTLKYNKIKRKNTNSGQ